MAAIVHSQMLKLYAGPRSISGSFGASPSQAVVTAYLSQPSCVLSANAEGVVEDYAPASTTIVVEVSGRTDTGNWTISTTKSTSVGTVTVVGATVSVSGMTDDAGWVDITASKTGYEPVTRRFTLAKVRQKGGVRVATTLPANPSEVGGELAIFLDVADPALRGMYGWSGTAWVKTGELLNGSVTADKLAADAIQATKFASGIEPVAIVNLLPNVVGYTGPKLVFLTTDNKLYRYTGSSWVKELPAEDLTGQLVADQLASNSVTTGKIQAGAVTTDQLAARAVTASKMVLTDTSNIYPDYDILDSSFYSGAAFTRVASTSLSRGAYALRIAANAAESRVESQWFQVEPSAEYFVELSAYQSISGTTGAAAAYIEFGSFSGGETTPTVTRSELVLRRVSTTSLARADAAVTTASNERKARLVFIREAGGTGVAEFGGPVIRRRNNAKLIVDGSIVATKIATDAVQTHHLLAGAVTAEKLTVNKLSAITADMGDVTAGTFTLSSTGYIRGGATSFSAGTGFWMGYDAGTYKLRAGTPGSSGFEWTGSAFNVRGPDGSITISSGVVDWGKISGAGKPVDGATRNVFRGDWSSSSVAYSVGDIVLLNGNGWSCVVAHTSSGANQPPSSGGGNTWWTLYAVKGADGANAVVAVLSNESHVVPTDSAGNNGNYSGAATTITIYNGTSNDSANWTVTATTSNVSGSLSGKTYTVSGLSADTGYVDLTATRSGYASVVKRFVLSKSKAGTAGAQGPAVVVTSSRATTFTATDGVLDGSQADIVLTASVSGVTSPTYAWTFSGLQSNPVASTTNTQTITAAQFGTAKSATVTCTVNGTYKDQVTLVRLEKSTAAAGATVGSNLSDPFSTATWYPGHHTFETVPDGKVGSLVLRLNTGSSNPEQIRYIPLDRTKKYRVRFWARPQAGANGALYFTLRQYISPGVFGPGNTGLSPYKPEAVTPGVHNTNFGTDAWGEYSYIWTTADWQAGVTLVRPLFLRNYGGTVGYWEVQDLRFEEVTEVEAAKDSASAAQIAANTANNTLADIAADNKLTPAEKKSVRKEWDAIYAERAGIRAQADSFGITTEKTNYDNDFQALGTYLNGGTAYTIGATPPSWIADAGLSSTTDIVGSTFRSNWANLYAARQALLNKIAAEAAKRADWENVTGDDKPENGATKNRIFTQATAPTGAANGDIWIDTSVTPSVQKMMVGGSWQLAATVGANDSNFTGARGANLLRNTMLDSSTAGWATGVNGGRTLSAFNFRKDAYGAPVGYGALVFSTSGPVAAGFDDQLYSFDQRVPCTAGERIELQAWVQVFRGDVKLTCSFLLADGNYSLYHEVTGGVSTALSFADAAWSDDLADFAHLRGFVTAPANAVACYMELTIKRTTTVGITDLYVSRPYLGKAGAVQSTFSAWTRGVFIDQSSIKTWIANAAVGNAEIDRASINKLQVVTADIQDLAVDTLKIAGNAVTIPVTASGGYNNGDGFQNWKIVCTVPITLDFPAFVYAHAVLSQSFPYGDRTWGAFISISGQGGMTVGGQRLSDSASLAATRYLSAGSHTITLYWSSDSGGDVISSSIFALAVKR